MSKEFSMDLESQIFVCRCAEWAALQGLFVEWVESYAKWRRIGAEPFHAASQATVATMDC